MASFVDLVKLNTSTTGTGTLTLTTAVSGFRGTTALTNGATYPYSIQQGANFEVGYGLYTSSGTTFTRTVTASSNSNTAISLTAGAVLSITPLAADVGNVKEINTWLQRQDFSNGLNVTSGNVGIGTSSPIEALEVAGGNGVLVAYGNSFNSNLYNASGWKYRANGFGGAMRPADAAVGGLNFLTASNNTGGAGASATLDSVLQLTTSASSIRSATLYHQNVGASVTYSLATSTGTTLYNNQLTIVPAAGWVTGQIASAFVGDSNNGFSAENGGNITISGYNGFTFKTLTGTARWTMDINGNFYPSGDNAVDFGGASNRIKVYYGMSSSINTSDETQKDWRSEATEAELDAAWACYQELGFYQFKDSVAEKALEGKEARFHYGLRAQRVMAIFAEHGLVDPLDEDGRPGYTPYAFLCYDEWEDEFEDIYEERDVEYEAQAEVIAYSAVLGPNGQPIETKQLVAQIETRKQRVPTGAQRKIKSAGRLFGFRPDQLDRLMMAALKRENDRDKQRLANLEAAVIALQTPQE